MKKLPKKIAAAATLFAATMNLNGCVYGPPPEDFDEPMGRPMGGYEAELTEEYDPSENIVPAVYGPPTA